METLFDGYNGPEHGLLLALLALLTPREKEVGVLLPGAGMKAALRRSSKHARRPGRRSAMRKQKRIEDRPTLDEKSPPSKGATDEAGAGLIRCSFGGRAFFVQGRTVFDPLLLSHRGPAPWPSCVLRAPPQSRLHTCAGKKHPYLLLPWGQQGQ